MRFRGACGRFHSIGGGMLEEVNGSDGTFLQLMLFGRILSTLFDAAAFMQGVRLGEPTPCNAVCNCDRR